MSHLGVDLPAVQVPLLMADLFARFGIDVTAMALLIFGMYYRRYHDKELVTAAALFNIFVFAVMTVLSNVQFGVSAGFGLFAILALLKLRSESITKIEITYFFGSMAISVICSIHGTSLELVVAIAGMILLGAFVVDHPLILRSVHSIKVTLDKIDARLLSDPAFVNLDLAERLGVEVLSYQIVYLDYVNDVARINVYCRTREKP